VTSDYNNIIYKLECTPNTSSLTLSFTCLNFKEIFALSGKHFLAKYYSSNPTITIFIDFKVVDPEPGFDITLSLTYSFQALGSTHSA
jgi:hypothetical protein